MNKKKIKRREKQKEKIQKPHKKGKTEQNLGVCKADGRVDDGCSSAPMCRVTECISLA